MWKHELGQNYSEIFLKSYAHRVTYNLVFRIYKLQLNNHNILCNFEYSPSCPFEIDRINPIFKRERNELERWLRAVGSNTLSYFSIYVFTVTIVVTYFEKWGFWEKKVAEAQFEPLFLCKWTTLWFYDKRIVAWRIYVLPEPHKIWFKNQSCFGAL